jgi:hypothetical protein
MKRLLVGLVLLVPLVAHAQPYPRSATFCFDSGAWVPCPANSASGGGITGPTSTIPDDLVAWGNTTGTNLSDSGVQANSLSLLSANNTFTGNNVAPNFTLNNVAGIWKPLDFNTSGTQRWQIGSDNDAETGSNSGSDFDIFSYADNGTTLTDVLHIQRSTGSATFADNVVSPEFDVNNSSGNFRLLRYETSGAFDFSVGLDQVGNYTIFRHNPSNNQVVDTPVVINLSSGLVSLSQRPNWIVGSTTATPWDSVNLNPANFMPITPGTVAEVPVAILGDAISNGASGNSTAFAANFVSGDLHSQLAIYPSSTAQNAPSGGTGTNSVVQAGDAAILVSQPNSGLPALTLGVAAPDTPSPAGIRFAETSGGGASIALGVRPTFAGNLAWDSGNLNPANFFPTSGGTINGTLTVTGLTTLPGVVVSATAINATAPISAPLIQATGTGSLQGINDSGQLTASGPVTLGVSSSSSTTILGGVVIGQGAESGTLSVLNGITTPALNPSGQAPSITAGSGAGSGATADVIGTPMNGNIQIFTGSSPQTSGVVATVTASNTNMTTTPFCVISPTSAVAASVFVNDSLSSGTLTMSITGNGAALTASTAYSWNYICP